MLRACLLVLLALAPAKAVVQDPSGDRPPVDEFPQQQQEQQQDSPFAGWSSELPEPGNPACLGYVVQLTEPPAVQWAAREDASAAGAPSDDAAASSGGVTGGGGSGRVSRATLASGSVTQYAAFLKAQANAVASRALGSTAKVGAYYQYTLAGMYVSCLTPEEVEALRSDPGVSSLTLNTADKPATSTTPYFLGLGAPGGIWSQLGGLSNAGEDVVIGMLDGGYWPESPSFSDQKDPNTNSGGPAYGAPPAKFTGACNPGNESAATMCNLKVLGCQHFLQGLDSIIPNDVLAKEYLNCREMGSHGTHTASTAGGNFGAATGMQEPALASMSGIAPKARLAIYKVCWGEVGCPTAAIVAATEQAVKDGVDIISYSISGIRSLDSPIEVAFKNAAAMNIFISAAAGNQDSPDPEQVLNVGPWVTTVAASSHDRELRAMAVLGDSQQFIGQVYLPFGQSTFAPPSPFGPYPLILSDDAGLPGMDPEQVKLCYSGTLDPEKVRNKIVVCDRGINARVAKSAAVKLAGGVGMILVNTPATPDDNNITDIHTIPTVHLLMADRDAIRAYVASAGAEAKASIGLHAYQVAAPAMAWFSRQGPVKSLYGELLKPDITAPGVSILAAVSPVDVNRKGQTTGFLQGTSMATPHISGIAALLKQKFPSWSPMMIKSAIMTTAYQTTRTGPSPGQVFGAPFNFGAGHVDPTAALNPGVVFDSTPRDWERFVCGVDLPRSAWPKRCPECVTNSGLCDAQRLNMPSISAPFVVTSQAVIRTVTSVLSEAADFTVSTVNPSGFGITVSPASFSLQPGQSQTVTITISWQGAQTERYFDGSISWSSTKGTVTRIPVVVKTSFMGVPVEVPITQRLMTSVNSTYNIKAGSNLQTVSTLLTGMEPARIYEGSVAQDPVPRDLDGAATVTVSVPAGKWTYIRFALFDADMPTGTNLDLYVQDQNSGVFLAGSWKSDTSDERIDLFQPTTTSFTVYIHGIAVPTGSTNFKLHVWVLRRPAPGSSNARSYPHAGNPARLAPPGGTVIPVGLTFNKRLTVPGQRYLGAVWYAADIITDTKYGSVPMYGTLIFIR